MIYISIQLICLCIQFYILFRIRKEYKLIEEANHYVHIKNLIDNAENRKELKISLEENFKDNDPSVSANWPLK